MLVVKNGNLLVLLRFNVFYLLKWLRYWFICVLYKYIYVNLFLFWNFDVNCLSKKNWIWIIYLLIFISFFYGSCMIYMY